MCTPVGNMIKTQVLNTVERFAGTADKKLASSDSDVMSANILGGTLYVQSASKTDKYHYVIHGTIKGGLVTLDNDGNLVNIVEDGSELTGGEVVKEASLASTVSGLDEGSVYYVEVINDGTGYTFTSNIVTKTDAATGESGSAYEIVDGDKDGLHYHNDELFTGNCKGSSYVNGQKAGCYDSDWNLLKELTVEMVEADYDDISPSPYGTKYAILPEGITKIGNRLFFGANSLSSVIIPNSVTSIGSHAFNSTAITTIEIPNSVTSIGSGAFASSRLTSITIPNSVTSFGNSVFSDCSSLVSVVMPDSLNSIGTSTFYKCTKLTSVTIPNGVTSIGSNVFFNCSSLKSITIPSSVTTINSYTFAGCSSLTELKFENVENWYYGMSAGSLTTKIDVTNASANATKLRSSSGTWASKYLTRKVGE